MFEYLSELHILRVAMNKYSVEINISPIVSFKRGADW